MSEAALSDLSIYSARPTVLVDTKTHALVTELITGMEMTEQEGGMCALELRLSNVASDPSGRADFAFEDNAILKLGSRLVVYAGDENAPREIFQGSITGLESAFVADGPPELIVLAEDAFQQARMTRRTKVHDGLSLADLAKGLAGKLGLTLVVTGLTENIGTQVQLNESDLAFLRRLLARYHADLQVVGKELHVSPVGDVKRGDVELMMYSQLLEARVLADLAHQVTAITVTGWDADRGEKINESSRGAQNGPGRGRTGAAVLQQAAGARSEHVPEPAATTATEARALAAAAFDERARRFLTLDATADGNPSIRVGAHVKITGTGPRFDNTYYVTRATHVFDLVTGYRTHFEATCAFWGG